MTLIDIEPATLCERCRTSPAVHTHHRKRRSQGGLDSPENTVRLCLACHQWVHDNPRDAAAAGWLVLSWQDPGDVEAQVLEEEVARHTATGREHDHLEPGEVCPTCGRKKPLPRDPTPRPRITIHMKVPVDERENGVELWYEMIQIGREMLCERMGWDEDVPMYNVAMVLVAQGLEAVRADA